MLTYEYDNTGSLLTQNVDDGRSISSSYNELGMVAKVTVVLPGTNTIITAYPLQ